MPKAQDKKPTIKIKYKGSGTLSIDLLEPMQGDLKTLSDENYGKFRNNILSEGFTEPISIWEDPESGKTFILNGHQRVEVLSRLRSEGYKIPQIPVNYIDAKNLKEAKLQVLSMASQYGTINNEGLTRFISSIGISAEDVLRDYKFPEIDIMSLLGAAPDVSVIGDPIAPMQHTHANLPVVTGERSTTQVDDLQKFISNDLRNMVFTYTHNDFALMVSFVDMIKKDFHCDNASDALLMILKETYADH